MNKEEFLKAIMELPKAETINPISAMNSINIDDLMSVIDRLNKTPTYDELLKENKKLKMINKEYERLNKENYRGFKIINVQEYDIYELLSYKNNWNELKKWVNKHYDYYLNNEDYIGGRLCFTDIKSEMQKLERSDSNE